MLRLRMQEEDKVETSLNRLFRQKTEVYRNVYSKLLRCFSVGRSLVETVLLWPSPLPGVMSPNR